jgi:hypothetical protein
MLLYNPGKLTPELKAPSKMICIIDCFHYSGAMRLPIVAAGNPPLR